MMLEVPARCIPSCSSSQHLSLSLHCGSDKAAWCTQSLEKARAPSAVTRGWGEVPSLGAQRRTLGGGSDAADQSPKGRLGRKDSVIPDGELEGEHRSF